MSIALQAGISQLPAEILQKSDFPDHFISVIAEQLTSRPLNLVETARVIGICEALELTSEKIIHEVLPAIDLPSRPDLLLLMKEIRDYPVPVQLYIELYHVSLKHIRMFSGLSDNELRIAAYLGHALQLTPFDLSEVLTLFTEISQRESSNMVLLFNEMELEALLKTNQTRNEKIQILKTGLRDRRYPRLTAWKKTLEQMRQSMSLPGFAQLTWDKDLEKPGVVLNATLKSYQDVHDLGQFLSDKKNHENLEKMFEIL